MKELQLKESVKFSPRSVRRHRERGATSDHPSRYNLVHKKDIFDRDSCETVTEVGERRRALAEADPPER